MNGIEGASKLIGQIATEIDKDVRAVERVTDVLAVFDSVVFLITSGKLLGGMHWITIVGRYA